MPTPVGILGGTFDPIHHGHLRLALECRERLQLAEVRIIPVHTPPHREPAVATAAQRLRMIELAIRNAPGLVADDMEIRRGGLSYTVDTLGEMRTTLGARPVCLILGIDAFRQLHRWRQWTALLELVHIVVAQRPGTDDSIREPELQQVLDARCVTDTTLLGTRPSGCILRAAIPLLDISASQIRQALAAGSSARFLLPETVLDYIGEQRLYREPSTPAT